MAKTRSQVARKESPLPTRHLSHVLVQSLPPTREPSPQEQQVSINEDVATEIVEPKATSVLNSEASTAQIQVNHAKPLLLAKTLPTPPSMVLSSPVEISIPANKLVPIFPEAPVALSSQKSIAHTKPLLPAKTLPTPPSTVLSSPVEIATLANNLALTFPEQRVALPIQDQIHPAKLSTLTKRLPPLVSPFLRLPVEIRTRIYALVLTFPEPIHITHHHHLPTNTPFSRTSLALSYPHYRPPLGGTSALSLAFTCRLAYLESTPLYYSLNTFQYTTYGPLRHQFHEFLRAIGLANRDLVHNIQFVVDGDCNALVDLGHLPALRCLTIVLGWPADRCRWSGVPKEALMGLARMSGTLERVVLRYGGPVRGSAGNLAMGLNERDVEEVNEFLRGERGKVAGTGTGTGGKAA